MSNDTHSKASSKKSSDPSTHELQQIEEHSRGLLQTCLEFSLPLLLGVVVALVWKNLGAESYEDLVLGPLWGHGHHSNLHFIVNDVFMAFFFAIAAKEVTESALPGGVLNPPSKAINPLMATLGGVVGPIAVYFLCMSLFNAPEIFKGWGIPTATDIALAWLVARLTFGPRHPAVKYLLLLAVADDGIGLAIIAIFYPDPAHPVQLAYMLLVLAAVGIAFVFNKKQVHSFWWYLLVPGVLSWSGFFLAHLLKVWLLNSSTMIR